jgi:hypothetical protein
MSFPATYTCRSVLTVERIRPMASSVFANVGDLSMLPLGALVYAERYFHHRAKCGIEVLRPAESRDASQ